MYLNLSWPAVSQIWSLMRLPGSISTRREKKSTPTVGSDTCAKRPSVKRLIKQDFPTVESPMTISRNWYSHIASISYFICQGITVCCQTKLQYLSKPNHVVPCRRIVCPKMKILSKFSYPWIVIFVLFNSKTFLLLWKSFLRIRSCRWALYNRLTAEPPSLNGRESFK